jgi:hypothetical protein
MYNPNEPFIQRKWRPALAWSYIIICLFDFMVGPILFGLAQAYYLPSITEFASWSPLTLQGGGLYHVTMLAILGIYTHGRTREKITERINTVSEIKEEMNKIL